MGPMSPYDPAPDSAARHDGWATLRRFLPYLWPKDRPALKRKIVIAVLLVIASKAITLSLPYAYKLAVDAMAVPGPVGFQIAFAMVLAFALGRFTSVVFDNLRNIVFERVGQEATRQ